MAHQDPHARLDALLAAHAGADEKETGDAAFIRDFLRRHPDAMSRRCAPGHITGSALVLHAASFKVLLTLHRKLNRWLQFGGHMETETHDERDPADTALREASEESGLPDLRLVARAPIDVDVHTIPARGAEPEHLHLDLRYLALTERPECAHASHESHEIRWFTIEECESLALSEEMRRLLKKATSRAFSSTPRIPGAQHR